jgi:hypothetical protein
VEVDERGGRGEGYAHERRRRRLRLDDGHGGGETLGSGGWVAWSWV